MSCIFVGIVQCISVVLAVFIKTLYLGIWGENPQFLDQFLLFKLQNVEDKCLYKMQIVLYQYINRKPELFGI